MKKFPWIVLLFVFLVNPAFSRESPKGLSLNSKISNLVSKYEKPGVDFGILIENLSTGEVIYSKNDRVPFNPASNQKLLTTYASLKHLGPKHRFRTQFLAKKKVNKDGVIPLLVLRGLGDPSLTSLDITNMVHRLKSLGVKKVEKVGLDKSYFDQDDFPGRFRYRRLDAKFNAPVCAIALDKGLHHIQVKGSRRGQVAHVEFVPSLPNYPVVNQTMTRGGKRSSLRVRNRRSNSEDIVVQVSGRVSARKGNHHFSIAQTHPCHTTGYRLLYELTKAGIEVPKTFEFGKWKLSKVLVEHQSQPLEILVKEINKKSDNFMTEQLTKVLGAERYGIPGSTAKGVKVIEKEIRDLGLSTERLNMENGSGLSEKSYITVSVLAKVLEEAYQNQKIKDEFLNSLSVAGVDGTLRKRFRNHPAAHQFYGKTGTLRNVTALSGYAFPKHYVGNGPFLIAHIANGSGQAFAQQRVLQAKIIKILVEAY